MSTERKLYMKFEKSNGDEISMSYAHIKNNVSDANIKSLMLGIVANGKIFEKVPAEMKSAYIQSTEKQAIDLS